MRSKFVIKNMIWELSYYLLVMALGFLAPRFIILAYGSEVNGLSNTITQMLNVMLLLQAGATTASVFMLYKPIAENDMQTISKNLASTNSFFRKIAFLFLGVLLISAIFVPHYITSNIDDQYISIAFFIMGGKSFLDLIFTSKYRVVFTAFQKKYILSIATLIEQVIYYLLVFLTIYKHAHFLLMYLWLFLGCAVKILVLNIVYRREFSHKIPKYKGPTNSKIPGRNYSLANEVAHSLSGFSITIILTFMYGLEKSSVYSVYALIAVALELIVTSFYSAFAPSFGNLVASGNIQTTKKVFSLFQYVYIAINTWLMMCMLYLIQPFVSLYTQGVQDANYTSVSLGVLLAVKSLASAYRIPYNIAVSTYGFFKDTWLQPVLSLIFTVVLSIVLGTIDYSLILCGPIVFYMTNFLYQHYKLRKLVPHLVSLRVFLYVGASIVGMSFAFFASYASPAGGNIVSLIGAAFAFAIIAFAYILLITLLFERQYIPQIKLYIRNLLPEKRT